MSIDKCDWCGRELRHGGFCSTRCATEYNKNRDHIPKGLSPGCTIGVFLLFTIGWIFNGLFHYTAMFFLRYGTGLQAVLIAVLLGVGLFGLVRLFKKNTRMGSLIGMNISLVCIQWLLMYAIAASGMFSYRTIDIVQKLFFVTVMVVCGSATIWYLKITKSK